MRQGQPRRGRRSCWEPHQNGGRWRDVPLSWLLWSKGDPVKGKNMNAALQHCRRADKSIANWDDLSVNWIPFLSKALSLCKSMSTGVVSLAELEFLLQVVNLRLATLSKY